jgi:hypothetical protein
MLVDRMIRIGEITVCSDLPAVWLSAVVMHFVAASAKRFQIIEHDGHMRRVVNVNLMVRDFGAFEPPGALAAFA